MKNKLNNFAPVLICTLNRYTHFKRCVESLSACTHADNTDLFIGLDYPLKDEHWEGYLIIKDYLPSISGFKTVTIIEREVNYGVHENFSNMEEYVFAQYDRLIGSEDDNEFAPNFLDYINKGLDLYEKDSRIYAICGYKYMIDIPQNYLPNHFIGRAFSGWGYGIWKSRHEEFRRDYLLYDAVIHRLRNTREALMNLVSTNAFLVIEREGSLLGDYARTAGLTLSDMYCVFPVITKVKNHGHDGSGVNCGLINHGNSFLSQTLDPDKEFVFSKPPNIASNQIICNILQQYFNYSLKTKTKILLRYILYRVKLACQR